MQFKTIARRIFAFVIPVIIVTMISFVIFSYHTSNSQINDSINEKMYATLNAANLEIQLELYKNSAIAMDFASYGKTMSFDTFDHVKHEIILKERILSNKNTFGGGVWFKPFSFDSGSYYFGPFLYTVDGYNVVYVPNYGDNVDYFNEDWYIKGERSNGKLTWSKVYYDPVSTITMVTATKPFFNADGTFMGVGTADMNIEDIRKVVNNISIGKSGKAFILGSNGEYISFYDEKKNVEDTMQADDDPLLMQLGNELMQNESGVTTLVRGDNKLRVYYMTMPNINWRLAVTVEEKEIHSSALDSFLVITIIPILGLLLIILGIFMVAGYLRKIVSKVNNFAELAASGDFSKRIDVTERDEFGFMEQRLNIMIANMSAMSNRSAELVQLAESASRSKSSFLSRMSHEIRTPMNAIIGMTQIAKASVDPGRIQDCLTKIDKASKHLLALINDILDMSKIEANKLELAEEEFSPEQTLINIYNMMLIKAEEKNQQLTLNVDKTTPTYVVGDELRFAQVVTNLVGNAIKFTPQNGTVVVSARETEKDGGHCTLEISVADSGIGLSAEQRDRLFKPFEQADGNISRKFGGTGLGLAISKYIIELMNGSIRVNSEPGKGSVFSFTVKVPRGSGVAKNISTQAEQFGAEKIKNLRILAVDDSSEANDYLKHVLSRLGFECVNVSDGYEAIEAVKNAIAGGHPYDIIFMDYMMPKLNGIETAKEIKRLSNASTAIIMASIYDWGEIGPVAQKEGISNYITKPFSPSCVLDAINEVIFGKVKNRYSQNTLAMNGFIGNTILIADDIDINREIVATFLEQTNVTSEFAENGLQAVEMFQAAPDKYDLILMDVQMPEMDGLEATRRIRRMPVKRARTIPIIAMTANALSEDVAQCREAGMNDHLAKPLEPDVLLLKLSDYFFMKDYLDHDIG